MTTTATQPTSTSGLKGATVECRGVSRMFKVGGEEVWAVHDVSLRVEPGEFVAMTGRSGSGKTTLINLIAGLDKPTSGEVWVDGGRVDTMSGHELNELRRHKMGFIFQSFGLLPLLSAQENVELPLRIAGYKHGERVKRARQVLDVVGLARRSHHRPYELSGGEQQRVAIARALAAEPSILLADEPTGELDSATATIVFGLLRDIARTEGITIITCTHDRLVMEMADRIEELADGRLVTGEARHLWDRVRERELSPFAHRPGFGPEPEALDPGGAGLSSLIGADTSVFKGIDELRKRERQDERAKEQASPALPPNGSAPADEEEPEEDNSRWARPKQR